MKKIKKLGKAASVALLAGVTVSSGAAATLGDFPQPFVDEDGTVSSTIVVGEDAKTADVVGAINIAGALGNSAYSTESAGTQTTVRGVQRKADLRASPSDATLDKSEYDVLARKTVTDDDSTDHFVVEQADLVGSKVSTAVNGSDVMGTVNSGALKYSVSYTPGFNVTETITLLGEEYTVTDTRTSPNEVDLGSTMTQSDLANGDSYTHGPYTVEVADVNTNQNEVFVRISKDENVLKSTSLKQSNTTSVNNGEFTVTAPTVFFGTETHITLESTYTKHTLTEGETSPLDAGYDVSTVQLNSDKVEKVEKIVMTSNNMTASNAAESDSASDVPRLQEGDSFTGPLDYFSLTYQGLTSETMESFKIKDGFQVTYKDVEGFEQTVNMSKIQVGEDTSLTTSNPWSGATDPVAFNDSGTVGTWESASDVIVEDYNNGGTYSAGADTSLNSGDNGNTGASAGDTLYGMGTITGGTYYAVSSDSTFDSGEDVVKDTDGDSQYTASSDTRLAGITLSPADNGTSLNATNPWSTVKMYDSAGDSLWNSSNDVIVTDDDSDGAYTSQSDFLINGSAPSVGTSLSKSRPSGWGNVTFYNKSVSGGWDSTADAIVLENDTTNNVFNGAINTQDIILAGNDSASGPLVANKPSGWKDIKFNDASGSGAWNDTADAIINDTGGWGTYSTGADTKLAGAKPASNVSIKSSNQFTNAPQVAFADDPGGSADGNWESGSDLIVTDTDNGGTVSTGPDVMVNNGGSTSASGGTALQDLNSTSSPSDIKWANVSGSGYGAGDEIYGDDDGDSQYTSQADKVIGGTAPGAGTTLTTTNPWSQIAFQDDGDSTWESSADIVANDTDTDQTFEAGTDVLIAGSEPGGILKDGSGDKTVYVDVSGHPVKIEFDDSKDEATLSYKTYSQKVAVGDGKTTKSTGYGFSLTTSFNSASGEEKLRVSGSDAQLDTLEGADLGYMTSGGTPYVRVDEDGNGYSENTDGEDFKVSYSSGDVNKVLLDGLSDLSSDNKEARTSFGTVVSTGSRGPVSVTHPEKKLQAEFAFGSVSESSSGTVKTPTSWPDSAALDSEVSQGERQSQDLILVGGPAVNDLTQQLAQAGKTWTQDQYQANPDVGILDLVNDAFAQGEHALVVAGAQAEDTTAAADFLANYQDHAERLQGKRTVQVSTGQ